jgi:hypothetical protein
VIFLAETKSGPQNGGLTALLGSVSAAIAPPALYNEPIPTATSSSVAGSDPGPTGSTEASKAPGPSTTAQSTAKANIADSGPSMNYFLCSYEAFFWNSASLEGRLTDDCGQISIQLLRPPRFRQPLQLLKLLRLW